GLVDRDEAVAGEQVAAERGGDEVGPAGSEREVGGADRGRQQDAGQLGPAHSIDPMAVVASGRRVAAAGWAVAGVCALLAALSLLAPFALIYDAWSWSLRARGLTDDALDTTGLSAWKPLPPLLGAPVALLGGSPAAAWLGLERAAALGALA